MDSELIDFILAKTKVFLIVSIFIAVIIMIFFGFNMTINYYLGFFIGVLNFILLSVGSGRIIAKAAVSKTKGSMNQTLFFLLRYCIVAGLLVVLIKYQDANVFALVIGLLTIHIALLATAIPNMIEKRKEG